MQSKAGGDPAAFDHVLVLMPTLFRQDEINEISEGMIKKQKPEPIARRGEPSSPTELPVPTEVCETPPTSPDEGENVADDQMLGVP